MGFANIGFSALGRSIGPLLVCAMLHGFSPCIAQIRYFQPATLQEAPGMVKSIPSIVKDSMFADTIFQVLSEDGYPVRYYKKVRTSVCFDNKCRLLKCTLYWNVTGRYLGFELEKGEYLSKAGHKPFKKREYQRLHTILADPFSQLAGLSYSELAPRPRTVDEKNKVDAVTSATAKNILDDVVQGAAYTTYKMWHMVYGETQQEVQDLTIKSLSCDFTLKILDSPDPGDKIWALNHIRGYFRPTSQLRQRVFSFVDNSQYNLAERAINSLDPSDLESDTVQAQLVHKFVQSSYAMKKLILGKFAQASHLTLQTVSDLTPVLSGTNPELINNVLDLFTLHRIIDDQLTRQVASLLTKQNTFVARNAYKYLIGLPEKSPYVEEQIKNYQNKQPRE